MRFCRRLSIDAYFLFVKTSLTKPYFNAMPNEAAPPRSTSTLQDLRPPLYPVELAMVEHLALFVLARPLSVEPSPALDEGSLEGGQIGVPDVEHQVETRVRRGIACFVFVGVLEGETFSFLPGSRFVADAKGTTFGDYQAHVHGNDDPHRAGVGRQVHAG